MKPSSPPEDPVVVFLVEKSRWAIPVRYVERVVQAVEIIPVPAAPPVLLGTIGVSGDTIPVYDLTRPSAPREIAIEDKLLLVRTPLHLAAFWASDVAGVLCPAPADYLPASFLAPSGSVRLAEGIASLLDPGQFLSASEEGLLAVIFLPA